ncbi:PEP-CTERM system TPR-repeat protein PrsT [Photobacterium sp. BZF1]|uniref:XrtA/PEP-CTERM system TPR-repeat protein PrsT n=1 Tax=Photobacterium sp. BZF1 TaxID=1904457 RepID=UPI0016538F1B|nr:XrtA/PEP-CTERM system TPR-repeat protein PrsT [Photobacterium sp. BZF1]MBC7003566.1 PEP-CTERM system TPR-repeat protein PrsT [Photobacterium sp. BZF1]
MSYRTSQDIKKFTIVGLLTISSLYSTTSFANKYIESAESYLSKNEVNAAIIELKNAIQQSTEDALPRYMLGKLYLEQGNYQSAEKELSKALKFGSDAKNIYPLLAQAMLNQNKLEEVILLLDESQAEGITRSPDLLGMAAIAEIRLGNRDAAELLLKEAGNSSLYSQLGNATLLADKEDIDGALEIVDALTNDPTANSDVWLFKGHLESAKQDYKAAYESYSTGYEMSPYALQYTLFIAQVLVNDKRFEEAGPLVDNLLKINDQSAIVNELKSILLYVDQNYADAKLHADRAINNGSRNLRVSTISGVSAFQLGQYEQAHRVFSRITPLVNDTHISHKLLSVTQLKLGYVDEAVESLNSFNINSEQDSNFISKASLELSKMGRNEEALHLAQKASLADSSETEAALGLIKLANNDISGIDNLQNALDTNPKAQSAKLGLAYHYLKLGKLDDAQSNADKWLSENPQDETALLIKGLIEKSRGDIEAAEKHFIAVRELNPKSIQPILALAEMKASDGDLEEALALTREAKEIAPEHYKVNRQFLSYSQQLDRLQDAIELLDAQIDKDQFNPNLKVHKAQALMLQEKETKAINLLESVSEADKNEYVWELLGNIYYTQNNTLDAEKSYQKWLKIKPYNPVPYLRIIQLSAQNNQIVKGLEFSKKAQKAFPQDVRFPLMKTALLIKKGDFSAAKKELNALPESVRDTAYTLRLDGIILVSEQNFSAAVDVQKRRYELMPNVQTASELASAYSLNNQNTEALAFLKDVIEKHGEQAEPLKIKVAELQLKSHPEKAIEQYEDIIAKEPDNVIALNNLAWLYLDSKKVDQACQLAEKAYSLANRSVEVTDTYGYCLLKAGKTNNALELLESAYKARKNNAEIALHFAEGLVSDNKLKQAKDILDRVITDEPKLVATKSMLELEINNLEQ